VFDVLARVVLYPFAPVGRDLDFGIHKLIRRIKSVCKGFGSVVSLTPHYCIRYRGILMKRRTRKTNKGKTSRGKGGYDIAKRELIEARRLIDIISRGKYQWQATFDAISDPVLIIDERFRIVRANKSLASVAGKDIRLIIGKPCYREFAGNKKICLGCPAKKVLDSSAIDVDYGELAIHGRQYAAKAFSFWDEVDKASSVVVHYRDITEERRLQEELIQQEKMASIGMLASGIAHEINNPIGGIIAISQLIKRRVDESHELYKDIEEIESAARRCKQIVGDLLNFARPASNGVEELINLNSVIEGLLPLVKAVMKSGGIEIRTDFDKMLPLVRGNRGKLGQVFLNLITNAFHAMDRGGVLSIRTYRRGDKVFAEVCDTGCGISKEDLGKVFNPFFTTRPPGEGTGLGLFVSYGIIKSHGGDIAVESCPGKGSIFTVSLPAA